MKVSAGVSQAPGYCSYKLLFTVTAAVATAPVQVQRHGPLSWT